MHVSSPICFAIKRLTIYLPKAAQLHYGLHLDLDLAFASTMHDHNLDSRLNQSKIIKFFLPLAVIDTVTLNATFDDGNRI